MTAPSARLRRGTLGAYLSRALRLLCPLCGERPLFRPLKEVRGVGDWLQTVPGCSRCGYAYEREPGYFLLATWGINYGVAAVFATLVYLTLDHWLRLSTATLIVATVLPTALVGLLSIRHAKAVFLALDRFLDP